MSGSEHPQERRPRQQTFEIQESNNMSSEDDRWNNWGLTFRKCLVEFIGVLIFVYIGSLGFTMPASLAQFPHAICHGLTIALLIISMGHISGGHYNPAVTLGVAISGNIHPILAVLYMISQLLGGFVGALFIKVAMTLPMYCNIAGGTTDITPANAEVGHAVLVEIILTYILVQTVLTAAVDSEGKNVLAPLAIGLAVLVDILAGGDKSGSSMNPARSFGPAVAYSFLYQNATTEYRPHGCKTPQDIWEHHYIHWVGPLIGAAIAGIMYKLFLARDEKRVLFS